MALLKKVGFGLVWLLVGTVVGFYHGQKKTTVKEVVEYVQGDPIEKVVTVPEPYYIGTPLKPFFFFRNDTVIQDVDTARIINDWITERRYRETLFDDKNGKLDMELSLQYNQLQSMRYSYLPVQKVVTNYKEKAFSPYMGVSYYSNGYASISGGVFYKDIGIEVGYLTDLLNNSLGLGFRYKF